MNPDQFSDQPERLYHHENCDVWDSNPEGIEKPCNCHVAKITRLRAENERLQRELKEERELLVAARAGKPLGPIVGAQTIVNQELETRNLRAENERLNNSVKQQCVDWADDHTKMQEICRKLGFSDDRIEGDTYSVPTIICLAEMIRDRLTAAERVIEACLQALSGAKVLADVYFEKDNRDGCNNDNYCRIVDSLKSIADWQKQKEK